MTALIIFSALFLILMLILLYSFISSYHGIVHYQKMVQDAWSGIDIQLKKRADLIPDLVETIKRIADREKKILENVRAARSSLVKAHGQVRASAEADVKLSKELHSLFLATEDYPDLKANQDFLQLQAELTRTEDQIAAARRIYNSNVSYFNNRIQSFPNNLLARYYKFRGYEYFEADGTDRQPIPIKW